MVGRGIHTIPSIHAPTTCRDANNHDLNLGPDPECFLHFFQSHMDPWNVAQKEKGKDFVLLLLFLSARRAEFSYSWYLASAIRTISYVSCNMDLFKAPKHLVFPCYFVYPSQDTSDDIII